VQRLWNLQPFVECSGSAGELAPGHTLFLAVQPKFMNVDIRITIDVTQGALTVREDRKSDPD
jgi:hypothetical protein